MRWNVCEWSAEFFKAALSLWHRVDFDRGEDIKDDSAGVQHHSNKPFILSQLFCNFIFIL